MYKLVLCGLMMLLPAFGFAQIKGIVIDAETGEPLASARVLAKCIEGGAMTEEDGSFSLDIKSPNFPCELVLSYPGYLSKKLEILTSQTDLKVELESRIEDPVVITGTMQASHVSMSAIKVEVLNREFLRQIPGANNLMESIDYVNGVQKQINCGVCGTNDIHLNGMEGPYTLVLIDGMPIISALGTVYGLNGIPSSMIERIEIVKGPASTLYGSEAVAGIVNVITRDPKSAPKLFFEGYGTSHGESNLDFAARPQIGKLQGLFSGNYYRMQNRLDSNNDNFTDIPLSQRLSLFNKWTVLRKNNRKASFAAKYYHENRFGGQLQWTNGDVGSDSVYGEYIATRRIEALGSYQLPFSKETVRLDVSGSAHWQDSHYGNTPYLAQQHTGFSNLVWLKSIDRHNMLFGSSVRYTYYDDNTAATPYGADVNVLAGLFVQDEWRPTSKLSLLGGARVDRHQKHGLIFSPRVNLRYKPTTFSTLRATAGTGFRTVNIFTEEHAALTGARTVVLEGTLAPERSVNVNANYNQIFNIGESAATFDVDGFYSHFYNKIFPDYNTDPNKIIYRNLDGYSTIKGFSWKYSQSFKFPFRAELGGTFMKVQVIEADGSKRLQEFAPVYQSTFNLSYTNHRLRTTFDYSGKIVGPMQLPVYDAPFERPSVSPWFTEQNVQASRNFGKTLTLKLGVRNVFNYRQSSPLVNPQDPFSDSFDTAYAYGPLQGRRLVFGMIWKLDADKKHEGSNPR